MVTPGNVLQVHSYKPIIMFLIKYFGKGIKRNFFMFIRKGETETLSKDVCLDYDDTLSFYYIHQITCSLHVLL